MPLNPTIEAVVSEHADEASFLWLQRGDAVHAPNYSPQQFSDLDERLEAHVDGLRVAAEDGWKVIEAGLENEAPEDFFSASVLAIEASDGRFADLLDRATGLPDVAPGVISGLGWVHPKFLSGRVKALLGSTQPFHQMLGIAACAVHRKDPGTVLGHYLTSAAAAVRARALRTAGELGRADLLPALITALSDSKQDARFWAARSAVLLGNRGKALDELVALGVKPGVRQMDALRLVLLAMETERGHELLTRLADVQNADRLRIVGAGLVGNVHYVDWLIEQMANPTLARVAGEAFVNITGADFNLDQLETMPPEDFEEGPTDDPADENVEVPEDVALLWPNVERVSSWWERNRARFTPTTRYFLGVPVSTASCVDILKTGFQRQRVNAGLHVSLLNPGTVLFNTSAPAPRQRGLLAAIA
jgi:uncharacterized protein (TIGR02270 family)